MKKIILPFILITILATQYGCGTGGAFTANNITNVELSEPNFNIVARDMGGSAVQGYLLGISFTQGSAVSAFGLVRIAGDEKLYDTAVKDLWKNYQEKYGDIEGKKLALVNIRHDSELLNTILYTQVKHFITADVVEFIE
jgi:hypothetical protein